jgi:hypothetical protein
MKMKKNIITLTFIAFALCTQAFRCSKDNCTKDTLCTTDFKTITLEIIDLTLPAQPVTVDVFDEDHNKVIHANVAPRTGTNIFELFSDADFAWLSEINVLERYRVDIRRSGTVVKSIDYLFGRDCCHVMNNNEPASVTLQ